MSEVNASEGYNEPTAGNPTAIIALAQKLHDDYVADGKAQAAEMIDRARTEHDRLLTEASQVHTVAFDNAQREAAGLLERANETAVQAVREAQLKAKIIVAEAEDRATSLTDTIQRLQTFEASYRANLKALAETALESLSFGVEPQEEISLPDTVDFGTETEILPVVKDDLTAVEDESVVQDDVASEDPTSDVDSDVENDSEVKNDDSEEVDVVEESSDESESEGDTVAGDEGETTPEHKE